MEGPGHATWAAPVPSAAQATPPAASAGAPLLAGWGTALWRGLLAFGVMALLGQVVAFLIYLVGDVGDVPASTFVRIGWFYFGAFHHVGIVASLPNLDIGELTGGVPAGSLLPTGGSLSYEIGISLLFATALAAGLLYRAGRAVADRAGGGPVARMLHGLKVAPVYALPAFGLSLLVSIRVPFAVSALVSGLFELKSSPAQSLALPLLIAAVAGAAGGFRSAREIAGDDVRVGRVAAALGGGWRMLVLGLGLSYLGLFVAGAVQPDEPVAVLTPSTAKYYQEVFEDPDEGALVFAHHLAVAPNEALWVLVPAMGGCDGINGGVSFSFLCYWRYPQNVELPQPTLGGIDPTSVPTPQATFDSAPPLYLLFLLAPLIAVLLGGRQAARRGGPRTLMEAGALGATAGVVFAVLVVAIGYVASVSLGFSASFGGLSSDGSVRIGPDLVSGALVALGWGVVGGFLGAIYEGRRLPVRPEPAVAGLPPDWTPPAEPEVPPIDPTGWGP